MILMVPNSSRLSVSAPTVVLSALDAADVVEGELLEADAVGMSA